MLNLFRKKEAEFQPKSGMDEKSAPAEISGEDLEKEIIIHTMPKQFLSAHHNTTKAKKAGLAILIGGFVFLVAASVLLYLFLFKYAPPVNKNPIAAPMKQKENEMAAGSVEKNKEEVKTTSEQAAATVDLTTGDDQATTTATSIISEIGPSYIFGVDADADGLTDKEEELLKTNAHNADTDADGYDDLSEIMNFYDPLIYAGGRLANSPNIKEYKSSAFNFEALYPAGWAVSTVGGADSIMFKTSDNQFMQIIIQPNADRETIAEWYKKQFNVEFIDNSKLITGQDWSGIKNENGLVVYLSDNKNNYIFTVAYTPGESNILEYKNIFAMMIKALVIAE